MKADKAETAERKEQAAQLRDRFAREGLDSFTETQVLALLLTYGKTTVDEYTLASAMLEHFGTLKKILSADYEQLMSIEGLDRISAILIKIMSMIPRYAVKDLGKKNIRFSNSDEAGEYFVREYYGERHERLTMAALDEKYRLIRLASFDEGTYDVCRISYQKIADILHETGARYFIIAHNHIGEALEASIYDKDVTDKLMKMYPRDNTISLVEHYIVCQNKWRAIISGKTGEAAENLSLFTD
nr:hypothetical protein [Clostridia bacterium]